MTKYLKPSSAIATCAAIALLSACSATTSGVTNAVKSKATSAAAATVVNRVAPAAKPNAPAVAAQPTLTGDASLTCDQLKMEIGSVDAVLAQANADSQENQAGNVANQATNAAIRTGVARSGAARSVIGKVPFGMSMFNKALNSRAKAAENKRMEAQKTAQTAAVRRSSLMGIYTGKGCS